MKILYEYSLSAQREDFHNITSQVREAVAKSGVTDGITVIYADVIIGINPRSLENTGVSPI